MRVPESAAGIGRGKRKAPNRYYTLLAPPWLKLFKFYLYLFYGWYNNPYATPAIKYEFRISRDSIMRPCIELPTGFTRWGSRNLHYIRETHPLNGAGSRLPGVIAGVGAGSRCRKSGPAGAI